MQRILLFLLTFFLSGCAGGASPGGASEMTIIGPGSKVGPGRVQGGGATVLYYNPDNRPPDELQRLQEESLGEPAIDESEE